LSRIRLCSKRRYFSSTASAVAHHEDWSKFWDRPQGPVRHEWANDKWIWVKETGPRDSTTVVVFSHRLLLDSAQWDPQVEVLSQKYRCLQFDTRRHGKSPDPALSDTTPSNIADDLNDILTQETWAPIKNWILVGEEYGGWATGISANNFRPDQCLGLVLVNTPFDGYRLETLKLMDSFLTQWKRFGVTKELLNLLGRYHFGDNYKDYPIAQDYLEKWKGVDPEDILELISNVLRPPLRSTVRHRRIPAPTWFLRGEKDPDVTDQIRDALRTLSGKKINSVEDIVITGAGKVPSVTHPKVVTELLEDIIGGVHPRT